MTHVERVIVAPWVPIYVRLMLRLAKSETSKATLATYVIYHGMENEP